MFNVYKNQISRQTGSRNLAGPKTLPTIWHTYMKLVAFFSGTIDDTNLIFGHKLHIGTPYRGKHFWTHHIPTSCLPTLLICIHIEHICSFFVAFFSATIDGRNLSDSYFLFAEERGYHKWALENEHICSMCIQINKVGKQEVGIWCVQKRFPRYGVPIWSLWPNTRFLPSIVAEKNVTKNLLSSHFSQ
jgi:hypothetical protein